LSALAGGHFITGAWALVMIHDFHRGKDFKSEGLELEMPLFSLFTPELSERFQALFGSNAHQIDFRKYSKVFNPQVKRYKFGFEQLLK
jgi:hypothetical protein